MAQNWTNYAFDGVLTNLKSVARCAACTAAVKKLSDVALNPKVDNILVQIGIQLCDRMALDSQNVCPSVTPIMAQPVIDMFGRELLTKDRICD